MMDINVGFLRGSINFLIKKIQVEQLKMKPFLMKNQQKNYTNQLLETLMKETYTHLLQALLGGADLADMQLMRKFDKGFRLLLCVIDIYS